MLTNKNWCQLRHVATPWHLTPIQMMCQCVTSIMKYLRGTIPWAPNSRKSHYESCLLAERESSACTYINSALIGRMIEDSTPNRYWDIMLIMIGEVEYFVRIETRPTWQVHEKRWKTAFSCSPLSTLGLELSRWYSCSCKLTQLHDDKEMMILKTKWVD